jgi:hypothetical protein
MMPEVMLPSICILAVPVKDTSCPTSEPGHDNNKTGDLSMGRLITSALFLCPCFDPDCTKGSAGRERRAGVVRLMRTA